MTRKVTKEMIAERVKDIADNEGRPYTEDFLYRLMYFDEEICDCVLWSRATIRFFKINLIARVAESKGILSDKDFLNLSNLSLEEIKSALFQRENEKEICEDLLYFWKLLGSLEEEMPLRIRIHNKLKECLRQIPDTTLLKKEDFCKFFKETSRECQKYCRGRKKLKNDQYRERVGEILKMAEGLLKSFDTVDWYGKYPHRQGILAWLEPSQ